MIAGVSSEESRAGWLRNEEPEEIEVKAPACLEVRRIETEMAKAADFKWTVESNAADVIFVANICCHIRFPISLYALFEAPSYRQLLARCRYHSLDRRRKTKGALQIAERSKSCATTGKINVLESFLA